VREFEIEDFGGQRGGLEISDLRFEISDWGLEIEDLRFEI
jgi:hypothetical protein